MRNCQLSVRLRIPHVGLRRTTPTQITDFEHARSLGSQGRFPEFKSIMVVQGINLGFLLHTQFWIYKRVNKIKFIVEQM